MSARENKECAESSTEDGALLFCFRFFISLFLSFILPSSALLQTLFSQKYAQKNIHKKRNYSQ